MPIDTLKGNYRRKVNLCFLSAYCRETSYSDYSEIDSVIIMPQKREPIKRINKPCGGKRV